MACTGIEKRARDLARNKWLTEVGDWAAVIIACVAVMTMGLAIVCILFNTTE